MNFLSLSSSLQNKLEFRFTIVLHECVNVTCPTRRVYCKWKLPQYALQRREGRSPSVVVENNAVTWNYEFEINNCEMQMNSTSKIVQDLILRLSIRQETAAGFDRIGIVKINLAEYLRTGGSRKYLLENCNVNSTLKVSVTVTQVKGDPLFKW